MAMSSAPYDRLDRFGGHDGAAIQDAMIKKLRDELNSVQRPLREKFRADFILAHVPSGTEMGEIFRRLDMAEKVVFPAVGEAK
jgi:hypothetical protein